MNHAFVQVGRFNPADPESFVRKGYIDQYPEDLPASVLQAVNRLRSEARSEMRTLPRHDSLMSDILRSELVETPYNSFDAIRRAALLPNSTIRGGNCVFQALTLAGRIQKEVPNKLVEPD